MGSRPTSIQLGYALEASLGYYVFPLMVVLLAALVFAEPVSPWHAIALPLIWAALALYYADTRRQERANMN